MPALRASTRTDSWRIPGSIWSAGRCEGGTSMRARGASVQVVGALGCRNRRRGRAKCGGAASVGVQGVGAKGVDVQRGASRPCAAGPQLPCAGGSAPRQAWSGPVPLLRLFAVAVQVAPARAASPATRVARLRPLPVASLRPSHLHFLSPSFTLHASARGPTVRGLTAVPRFVC